MRYIIVAGDPASGFAFTGPFVDHNEAVDHADLNRFDQWSVAELATPDPTPIDPLLDLLREAERFIAGFEGDELQNDPPVDDLLQRIRSAL